VTSFSTDRLRKKENTAFRLPCGGRVSSGDSFKSLIFFLELLLAVALDRRQA